MQGWSPASAEYHLRESLIKHTILVLSLCTTGAAAHTVTLVSIIGPFVGENKNRRQKCSAVNTDRSSVHSREFGRVHS